MLKGLPELSPDSWVNVALREPTPAPLESEYGQPDLPFMFGKFNPSPLFANLVLLSKNLQQPLVDTDAKTGASRTFTFKGQNMSASLHVSPSSSK